MDFPKILELEEQRMDYTDEQIDAFLNAIGIKLLSYQREMIKKTINTDKIYITMPPNIGRTNYLRLMEELRSMLYGESEV